MGTPFNEKEKGCTGERCNPLYFTYVKFRGAAFLCSP
jgi:hypothetical protein